MRLYGQIGYEAYCKKTGWKSLATGKDLPKWKELKPEIKEAWLVAGNAIAEEVLSNQLDS